MQNIEYYKIEYNKEYNKLKEYNDIPYLVNNGSSTNWQIIIHENQFLKSYLNNNHHQAQVYQQYQ